VIKKLSRYYHTLKPLKAVQWYERFLFPIRLKNANKQLFQEVPADIQFPDLNLAEPVASPESCLSEKSFRFLNQSHTFSGEIDWNFEGHGKLWQYNLRYFDFLRQPGLKKDAGLHIIRSFMKAAGNGNVYLEPYPASLRVCNWVFFLSKHRISDPEIAQFLYAQFAFLSRTPEKHLQANHLLENYVSILLGGILFQNSSWIKQGEDHLITELDEQILSDGMYYELSPMYHDIILVRLMDLLNVANSAGFKHKVITSLKNKTARMLGWSEQIEAISGDHVPYFNDSVNGIAPGKSEISEYAKRLGINPEKVPFSDSGYRILKAGHLDIICDVGRPGVPYQPGHVHADALSFEMYINQKPVIVNTGTSTYELGERRMLERSTSAHNTVQVNGRNQSDVWAGFRTGKSANVGIVQDETRVLAASHDGYRPVVHQRTWEAGENGLNITDELKHRKSEGKGFLHLHPSEEVISIEHFIIKTTSLEIGFDEIESLETQKYEWCNGFNDRVSSEKLIYTFTENASIKITPVNHS